MNVKQPPFDNLKVRQAVACAIPYQKIMDAVLFGLAKPMFGASNDAPTEVAWPQPHGYRTDLVKAKQLLTEAGYPNGFETTISSIWVSPVSTSPSACSRRKVRADRHQVHHQQDSRGDLAHRAEQESLAALHQCVLRLARLSRVFLHLVLSRQEFHLQHDELSIQRNGWPHRWRSTAAAERDKPTYDKDVKASSSLPLPNPAHPALSALRQRGDAEERLGIPVLVSPPPRLPRPREGVTIEPSHVMARAKRGTQ